MTTFLKKKFHAFASYLLLGNLSGSASIQSWVSAGNERRLMTVDMLPRPPNVLFVFLRPIFPVSFFKRFQGRSGPNHSHLREVLLELLASNYACAVRFSSTYINTHSRKHHILSTRTFTPSTKECCFSKNHIRKDFNVCGVFGEFFSHKHSCHGNNSDSRHWRCLVCTEGTIHSDWGIGEEQLHLLQVLSVKRVEGDSG